MTEKEKTTISNQELDASFGGSAIYANRFIVRLQQSGVRLAFMEQNAVTETSVFRNAVLLSYPDAIGLQRLLKEMLASVEASLSANVH